MAGIIDDLCSTVDDNKFVIGDRVVVYSDSDEISESGYVSIPNHNIIVVYLEPLARESGVAFDVVR